MATKTPKLAKATSPTVWVLETGRVGDNLQAWALANALAWKSELRQLRFNPFFAVPNFVLGKSLVSLDVQRSDDLQPPWPDLVIAVGRRTVPVARWIQEQSNNRTKLVQLGRPRSANKHFDLVVSSPQYRVAAGKNVLHTILPIPTTPLPPSKEEQEYWNKVLTNYPRPWTGILLGGAIWPYQMTPEVLKNLSEQAGQYPGSLLVSTSPRTTPKAASVIRQTLGKRAFVHMWDGGMLNPHRFILTQSDRFIVTGDSASMLSETCATGKPVGIFELPASPLSKFVEVPGNILAYSGLINPPRDMTRLHARLIEQGYAVFVGDHQSLNIEWVPDDLSKTIERIHAMMDLA